MGNEKKDKRSDLFSTTRYRAEALFVFGNILKSLIKSKTGMKEIGECW